MKRFLVLISALAMTIPLMISGAGTASASTGRVVVFGTEVEKLSVYENPDGCKKLPATAHVLVNLTDQPVETYGDPLCLTPGLTVQPGYGTHVVPATGSFSAE